VADVRPFAAITYSLADGPDATTRTAPPYDVVSPALREELIARDPRNIVAVELAEGPLDPEADGNRYATASARLGAWLADGILVDHADPAFYVLEQRWVHQGRPIRRRALMAAVRLVPFSEGVVLPHERTLPKARTDRMAMIRATEANLSPVFGLFPDPDGASDAFFEAAAQSPVLLHTTDADCVAADLRRVDDPELVASIAQLLADRQIFIADGHHRYETSLANRDEARAAGAGIDAGSEFVLMALVNMDDPELLVLPTHRVARAPEGVDAAAIVAGLERSFALTEVADVAAGLDALAAADDAAYLVHIKSDGRLLLAQVRPGLDPATAIAADYSEDWKRLDVAILQELALDPVLDIHPDRPETLERLSFVKDAREALALPGDADVAFVMRATAMDQLRAVARHGETMPQKSTYFYPKFPSGMVLRSLRHEVPPVGA
jgi:uncharacterized protein (DUF1015 family)